MKKFLKILSIIISLIIILSISGIVNAFSVNMKLDSSSQLKAGSTVEVTLKIVNIDAGDGIDAIAGTLEYNKNVFDEVTEDSFEGINKWNVNIYSTDTQMFTVTKSSKVNTVSDVLKITLRVKDTVNVDSTEIKIKEIAASGGAVADGGTGDIEIQEVKFNITKESSQVPDTNVTVNETTNEIVNDTTNKVITNVIMGGNITTNKVNSNTNQSTGKLPQTGENVYGIITGVAIISVIAIVAFIKYRNLNIK